MPVSSSATPGTIIASRQLHHEPSAEAQESREQQRHHHLRDAAAEVAPSGRGRIRRADDVGREHHRGVELRDDERCADRADGEAEHEEGRVVVREADAHDRQRAEDQQPGVRSPRAEAVAEPADQQSREHGDRDRGNDRCCRSAPW